MQAELLCGAAEFSTAAKAHIAVGVAPNCLRTGTLPASDKTQNSFANPHVRGQFLYRGLDADALSPPRDLPDSLFKPCSAHNEAACAADATRAGNRRRLNKPRIHASERESEVVNDAPPLDFGTPKVN